MSDRDKSALIFPEYRAFIGANPIGGFEFIVTLLCNSGG